VVKERPISEVRLPNHNLRYFRASIVAMISASVEEEEPTRCLELFDARKESPSFNIHPV
jgi:hypothetical protein